MPVKGSTEDKFFQMQVRGGRQKDPLYQYTMAIDDLATYEPGHQLPFNALRPRQNGRHFPDDIFKCIFINENVWISIKISLKFVPKGPINNIPALV